MKKTTLSLLMTILVFALSNAQDFTTPNTGVVWTLDDIAAASPSTITVSGTEYTMLENIIVSENDELIINSDLTLSIGADLRLTVFGTFNVITAEATFTAIDEASPFEGFRFEENSTVNIQNSTIEYGGGLQVLTDNFILNNCTLSNNVAGVATGAVVSLSRGVPYITNNTFTFNETPAVGSAANRQVSAYIFNNYMEGNNQSNSNRPQINMGPTMATDTLKIIQNTIIGDPAVTRAGGIAVSNFTGGTVLAIMDNNVIQGNRYGITIVGSNAFAYMRDNVIEDNNIEGDPLIGGSGISLNTTTGPHLVIASGNQIRRNLWGITVIGEATINLGDDEDNYGGNIFSENENGGQVYALYNNTPLTIMAKNNCWIEDQESTAEEVEDVIFHSVDDASLGEVIYNPFLCGIDIGIDDNNLSEFSFYPNPVKNEIHFKNVHSIEKVEIYGIQGNLISTSIISEGENVLPLNLPSGLYFVKFSSAGASITKKMVVE